MKIPQILQQFFAHYAAEIDRQQQARIHEYVFEQFQKEKKSQSVWSWLRIVKETPHLKFGSVAAALLLFVGGTALFGGNSIAGEIEPKFGAVEIVRDGKTHIVRKRTSIKVGDIVRVADGNAELTLPQKITSTLNSATEVRIMDTDKVFVSEGLVSSQSLGKSGEISTSRGIIRPEDGAEFQINVSKTGETTVALAESSAEIIDWLDGRAVLNAGEEIRLRIDSAKLSNFDIPDHIKLSDAQIKAIDAKLIIARTKFFSGLEKEIQVQGSGQKDLTSAQKSFRSIVQVLKSDRHLNILRRTNPELIKNESVHQALSEKTDDSRLLTETKAIEFLFALSTGNELSIFLPKGDSVFFSRYVLIDQIFDQGPAEYQVYAQALKNEYVIGLLRKVINQESKAAQVSLLREEIAKLPINNGKTASFNQDLRRYLDDYLVTVLDDTLQAL